MLSRVRGISLCCALWAALAALPESAFSEPPRDPALDLREAGISLTDGASIYAFYKDGRFVSKPDRLSGRILTGTWKIDEQSAGSPARVVVACEQSWINGLHRERDFRRIVFLIYPGAFRAESDPPKGAQPGAIPRYFQCYWLIDEFVKTNPPDENR